MMQRQNSRDQLDLLGASGTATDIYLSKSRFLKGLRCPNLLWHEIHEPEKISGFDRHQRLMMHQGRQIGEIARDLYQDGILLPLQKSARKMHQLSQTNFEQQKTLFEAAALYKDCFAIADIMLPNKDGTWDLIEVKSTSGPRSSHFWDLAFQLHCFEGAGLKIAACYLLHINKKYKRGDELNLRKLFFKRDVTHRVRRKLKNIPKRVQALQTMLALKTPPGKSSGVGCKNANICPLEKLCWPETPQSNLDRLYHSQGEIEALRQVGIDRIEDVPDNFVTHEKQRRQIKAHKDNAPYINTDELKSFFSSLQYPLYFLDMEGFQTALPLYSRTAPFEQIPFLYSLHCVKQPHAKAKHTSYLGDGSVDPRLPMLEKLKEDLGDSGSIIAYSTDYEIQRLKHTAKMHPTHLPWFESVQKRFIDLHTPFLNFSYYNPKQMGSTSMKIVLPILVGDNYLDLIVQDGHQASLEYLKLLFDNVNESGKKKMYDSLSRYCARDTSGMIDILYSLEKLI